MFKKQLQENITIYFIQSAYDIIDPSDLICPPNRNLTPEEAQKIVQKVDSGYYPNVDRIYTSPELQSIETSSLIYRGLPALVIPDLRPIICDRNLSPSDAIASLSDNKMISKFSARNYMCFKTILREAKSLGLNKIAIIASQSSLFLMIRKNLLPRSKYFPLFLEPGNYMTMEYDITVQGGYLL